MTLCAASARPSRTGRSRTTPAIFYGSGSRYFGVELEINCAGKDSENACRLMRLANQDRELLCFGLGLFGMCQLSQGPHWE